MNPVREAIFDLLDGDSELSAMINGVFWESAPQGTDKPVVIYSKAAGTRRWAFGGPPMRNEVYLVRGVGFADDAEDIDDRCQEILTDASLIVDGRNVLLKPLPDDDVNYEEEQYGEIFQHTGTYYRIVTERAS